MSLYKDTQPSFHLTSEWEIAKITDTTHPHGYLAIVNGPTEAVHTVNFAISIPAGAIVAEAWIAVDFTSSPKGGVKYRRMNGENIPSDGKLPINVTPDMDSYEAVFSFASYGTIEDAIGMHSGSLGIGTPTLYVDYVDTAGGEVEGDSGATAVKTDKGDRLPRLLDADLHERARLRCLKISINLNIDPLSTAEMQVPAFAPVVSVDDFVELFSPYGSVGIFRVYRTDETVGRSKQCELRHGIVTLADDIVTAGNAIQAPVGQVFASLFAMQSKIRWVMGRCEVPEDLEIVLQRDHQNLLAALSDLTAKLPDGYYWDFDQTVSPWEANLVSVGNDTPCEFRFARNLESVTVTVDRDSRCTRVYAYGAGEGEERIGLQSLIGTPYLDADNIDDAGVIAKSFTQNDIYDALTLRDVAQRYLDRHKEPDVSIQANAIDLSRATGLSFDRFHLGKLCRLPLNDYGFSMMEKVVSIKWRDVVGSPMAVEATLANRLRTASDELAELMREATSGKLIGGTVNEETNEYNYDSVTQSSALDHRFQITGYGNTLSVRARYTPAGGCRLVADGVNEIPASESESGSVDILRYLKSDENGVPLVGQHFLLYYARGTAQIAVNSKVTVKTIEKR